MTTTTLDVKGMVCNACAGRVEQALLAVPGVQAVEVDLAAGQVRAEHQGADPRSLISAVAGAGYRAETSGEVP